MYQFVHGVSYIPEDILLLHPSSSYDTCNCSYVSVPYGRAYYYSLFPQVTFLELTATLLQLMHQVVQYLRDLSKNMFKCIILYN